ncbi:Transcriptional regulator, GntR family domain / Aspartate aminotransferase [Pseudonocardia sp. Ae168_Ps1]|uniref:aminotransferase-like domain-containing protein n=1 Tax=unclassified Pseudonocardia TaxID=2619320 RepID=UPI00094AD64B|nr:MULTISPECIES: PLP-dependent aminotransferase family protein [unclassified Pseudonocardia]OLL70464.1 Transcriptional regulator, GntR family domain / Aspartate aminotransferase [Pseudonocardia sp. Ae168_Ps1]OLL71584.1 Transcriptional regulator, GntR family domain / Aspartate aminotransferase [Pseudonocardia sp. Ae263_Ps1]
MASETAQRKLGELGTDRIAEIFERVICSNDLISFAAGAPSHDLLPTDLLESAVKNALARYGSTILQYGEVRGFTPLIEVCSELLAARGMTRCTERIHIATGGSGALNNIAGSVLDPGDVVLVETPTYGPALSVFRSYGAEVVQVATDNQGIAPDSLDTMLSRFAGALVYLLPTFQNPTGATASAARRMALAAVLLRHDALAIEDDVYCELRYSGTPEPALCSYAPDNVAYITSLSKTLAPALRIGISVLPDRILKTVLRIKRGIDMQTSSLCQATAAEAIKSLAYEEHLQTIRSTYERRMQTIGDSLTRHLTPVVRWRIPDGGLFVWLEGPPSLDADSVVREAIDSGVAVLPGSAFHADPRDGRNTLRLSIAAVQDQFIDQGVQRLAMLIESKV